MPNPLKGRRPSPPMIVAIVALIASLAGTGMAASVSVLSKPEKKQIRNISKKISKRVSRRIANRRITKRAPGLAVKSATNASNLGGAPPSSYVGEMSSGYGASCNPASAAFVDCATTSLSLPRAGKVLLVAGGGQSSALDPADGDCRLHVDGGPIGPPVVEPGEPPPPGIDNTDPQAQNGFSLTAVTAPLAAGAHTFALACSEGLGDQRIDSSSISAVLVG